jgi:hypothetical protein
MRVANSALYARRTPVVTLPQAIAWLGIREIRNIAFAVAVQGQVFNSAYFNQAMNELWRNLFTPRCLPGDRAAQASQRRVRVFVRAAAPDRPWP